MASVLSRFVDLRQGEGGSALRAFAALLGIIAGHTVLETARDALFLSKLPPGQLALVYAMVAVGALGTTGVNTRMVRRFGHRNTLIVSLLGAAYGTILLHFLPQTREMLYVLYVWSALVGSMLAAQFWMYAGQRFTVAQGKRLFGPIASGGVAGAVVAAAATAAILAMIQVRSLLLVTAALFVVTAVLATTLDAGLEEEPVSGPRTLPPVAPGESPLALFRRYAYLRRMAALAILSSAALLVTDYLFKSIVSQQVPHAELGAFFARTYAVLNAVSLAVQLLLTGRILRQLGVVPALGVLPFLLVGGSFGLFVTGGALVMALLTKGADGALRYSLHRVGSELLWMPLPGEVRDRTKTQLDSGVGRLVQAAMAGLLLLLGALGVGTPRVLALLAVVLAGGWLLANISLQRSYLDLLRQALSRGTLEADGMAEDLDVASVEALMEALSSREAPRVLAALELLHEKGRFRLVPGLILYHESEVVLLRALSLALQTGRRGWAPLVERLLTHPDDAVRAAAARALGGFGELDLLRGALGDPSPAVRAHAGLALAFADPTENPRDNETLRALLALEGEPGKVAVLALLDVIRDHPDPRSADLLLELLRDGRSEVTAGAIGAMATIEDPRFIPPLLARLGERAFRGAVREALVHQGEPALLALAEALRSGETPHEIMVHLPRTVSRFGTQRAADLLTELLARSPFGIVRYKALRGLGRLVADSRVRVDTARIQEATRKDLLEHLRLIALAAPLAHPQGLHLDARAQASASLVLALLADKQRQSLERAFRLLQILHRREDIRASYLALAAPDKRIRAQALELVDALIAGAERRAGGERSLRELFRLAIDDLPVQERIARASRLLLAAPATYRDAIVTLLRDRDEMLAMFAACHALELGDARLAGEVEAVCVERPYLVVAMPLASRRRHSAVPGEPVPQGALDAG